MKISIIGTGAYGIALAKVFYKNGNEVCMYTKIDEELEMLTKTRENSKVLPGIKIDESIKIINNIEECLKHSSIIILAVPMKAVREISKLISKIIEDSQIICIVSKGIEENTNKLMSQVVFEETSIKNICMLSGPSFAIEIANFKETGLIVASENMDICETVKKAVQSSNIVVNTSSDLIGIQIAAASKNVFAILCGILDGMGKSDSTRAAILTSLINDFRLVVEVLGGKSTTVYSYAGIGDLLLTCMSEKSRNYTFGKLIGQGNTMNDALEQMQITTVEGLYALDSIRALLEGKQIQIKSIKLLQEIIYKNNKIEDVLKYIQN